MVLAEKIIKLRKQNGWSQEELAMQMNVSRQSVSKWESGTSIPDLNKIIRLSEIFNVSIDILVKDENYEKISFKNSNWCISMHSFTSLPHFSFRDSRIVTFFIKRKFCCWYRHYNSFNYDSSGSWYFY